MKQWIAVEASVFSENPDSTAEWEVVSGFKRFGTICLVEVK